MTTISAYEIVPTCPLRGTPAIAAGLTDELMDMSHIVKLIDDAEAAPKKHRAYKKKAVA
jgi:hypothetical protein